jgi:hypothetical protein
MLGAAAYAMLVFCGLVAASFLTAAGFIWLQRTNDAIAGCAIIAGIYAVLGIFGFLMLLLMQDLARRRALAPMTAPAAGTANAIGLGGFPGGTVAVGLLAIAGYLMAKSVTRKR